MNRLCVLTCYGAPKPDYTPYVNDGVFKFNDHAIVYIWMACLQSHHPTP